MFRLLALGVAQQRERGAVRDESDDGDGEHHVRLGSRAAWRAAARPRRSTNAATPNSKTAFTTAARISKRTYPNVRSALGGLRRERDGEQGEPDAHDVGQQWPASANSARLFETTAPDELDDEDARGQREDDPQSIPIRAGRGRVAVGHGVEGTATEPAEAVGPRGSAEERAHPAPPTRMVGRVLGGGGKRRHVRRQHRRKGIRDGARGVELGRGPSLWRDVEPGEVERRRGREGSVRRRDDPGTASWSRPGRPARSSRPSGGRSGRCHGGTGSARYRRRCVSPRGRCRTRLQRRGWPAPLRRGRLRPRRLDRPAPSRRTDA